MTDPKRELLRHTLATLAYRGCKAVRTAPEGFTDFQIAPGCRTPGQILAHIADLLDWALSMAKGKQEWHDSPPLPWDKAAKRFFSALEAFDDYLLSDQPLSVSSEQLFQGPIADGLTHVGQIAILRRLAGAPVKGENYFRAGIAAGRVGPDQAAPVQEFQ
jgi:hypothetical protein